MRARADIGIDYTLRIAKVGRRLVTIELEDGQTKQVREGERLTMKTTANLSMDEATATMENDNDE